MCMAVCAWMWFFLSFFFLSESTLLLFPQSGGKQEMIIISCFPDFAGKAAM